MYGRANPRTERRVLAVFWLVLLAVGGIGICKIGSVHVSRVRKRQEENGALLYNVEISNPLNYAVVATVDLAVGCGPSDSGAPWGASHFQRNIIVPGNAVKNCEFCFGSSRVTWLGPCYSATLVSVKKVAN